MLRQVHIKHRAHPPAPTCSGREEKAESENFGANILIVFPFSAAIEKRERERERKVVSVSLVVHAGRVVDSAAVCALCVGRHMCTEYVYKIYG